MAGTSIESEDPTIVAEKSSPLMAASITDLLYLLTNNNRAIDRNAATLAPE